MENETEKLRKRLLGWHYKKSQSLSIVNLLESGYQGFRRRVGRRLGIENINFREAIKKANAEELGQLVEYRDESRMGI